MNGDSTWSCNYKPDPEHNQAVKPFHPCIIWKQYVGFIWELETHDEPLKLVFLPGMLCVRSISFLSVCICIVLRLFWPGMRCLNTKKSVEETFGLQLTVLLWQVTSKVWGIFCSILYLYFSLLVEYAVILRWSFCHRQSLLWNSWHLRLWVWNMFIFK